MKNKSTFYVILVIVSGLLYGLSGMVACIVSSVCLATLVAHANFKHALIASAVALASCIVLGTDSLIMFLLGGILPGLFVGAGFRKKLSLSTLTIGSALCFAVQDYYLCYEYKKVNGISIFKDIYNYGIKNSEKMLNDMLTESGEKLPEDVMAEFPDILKTTMNVMMSVMPAILIVCFCFFALIVVFAAKKVAFKGMSRSYLPSFSEVCAPSSFNLLMFVCMIGIYFAKGTMRLVFTNVLLVCLSFCLFCGIAMVDFFLRKKIKHSLLRLIVYIAGLALGSLILSGLPILALLMAGMSDTVFDFRKLRVPGNR